MEIVTAILSSLGGLIGVIKNFLDLRIALKDLFKKDIPLNKAFSEISQKDQKILSDLYKAIDIGKDLTNRIYKKLAVKYLFTLVILFLIIVAGMYLMQTSFLFIPKPYLVLCISIATYFLITKGFPVPIKFNTDFLGGKLNKIINDLGSHSSEVGEILNNRIYKMRRVVGFISWMGPNENKYLQHYLDLCSLKDTLEMYWIDKKIEETKTYVFETIQFRRTFEDTLTEIIEDVLKNHGHIANNIDKITNHIKAAGLERFLLLFDDKFFQNDFQQQYDLYKRTGIKQIINQYW